MTVSAPVVGTPITQRRRESVEDEEPFRGFPNEHKDGRWKRKRRSMAVEPSPELRRSKRRRMVKEDRDFIYK